MNTPHIARECPRWAHCSVNNCPLAPHPAHPADRQTKCLVERIVRERISARYPGQLANGGLTAREAAGKRGFAALPPSVKSDMARRGRQTIAQINADKSGEIQ